MAIKIPKRHFGYDTLFSEKNSASLQLDADLGSDMDKGKSNSGNVFTLGSITVNWMFKFQKFLSLSILESEYVAIYKIAYGNPNSCFIVGPKSITDKMDYGYWNADGGSCGGSPQMKE